MENSGNTKNPERNKNGERKRGRAVISILASIGVFILTLVHIVFFLTTSNLLDGHKYGAPDKYGDYARGLYKSEVVQLSSGTKTLWLLLLGMIVLGIIAKVSKPKDDSSEIHGAGAAQVCLYAAITCLGICVLGTLYVSMVGGMYN